MSSFASFSGYYGIFPYYLITNGYNDFIQFPIEFISEDVQVNPFRRPGCPGINITSVPRTIIELPKEERIAAMLDEMIDVGKQKLEQLRKTRDYQHWICLVLNEDRCFFIDDEGVQESNFIPMGGVLRDLQLEGIATNARHYRVYPPSQKK